jgi:hypothetical protein
MSRFALQFIQSDGHTEKLEVKERNLEVCNGKEESLRRNLRRK